MRSVSISLKGGRKTPTPMILYDLSVGECLIDKYALWLHFRKIDENTLHGTGRRIENTLEGVTLQIKKSVELVKALKLYIYLIMDAQLNIKNRGFHSVDYLKK